MPNDVELIKSRLDIVDVVGEYVRLKQSGQNWKGLCPFHGEKTPSFMVHKEKQIWHCFGCGLGGDVFEFIKKIENVEFPEALEILARKAGVELTPSHEPAQAASQRSRLFQLLEAAAQYYYEYLRSSLGMPARQYLAGRGITDQSVAEFGLGYAPSEWDKLTVYLRNKNYSWEEIIKAGLAIKSERAPGIYDRFRDRLMFPIRDTQGRVVGFGGRTLDSSAKEAKYINSPQGLVYNKSLILYNLVKAKEYIKEAGYALLVEGYMDVVGCWQVGIKNVVATSGTALTAEQIRLLKRYTNEIRLAFDADLAGETAARRGIDLALAAELEVKVVTLTQGKDPDEAAKINSQQLKQDVTSALPIGDYAFQSVLRKVDVKTREGKKFAAQVLLAAIAKLPDPVEQDYYLKQLATTLDIDEKSLREKLPAYKTVRPAVANLPVNFNRPSREQMLSERLLALLIGYGAQLWPVLTDLEPAMLTEPYSELYRQARLQYSERRRVDIDELKTELNHEPTISRLIDVLALEAEHEFAEFQTPQIEREFQQVLNELKLNYYKKELKLLSSAISQAEKAGHIHEIEELAMRYRKVTQQIAELTR